MKKTKSTLHILITVPFEQHLIDEIKNLSEKIYITAQHSPRQDEITGETWSHTEVLYTDHHLPEPSQAPNLHWIQFHRPEISFIKDSPLINRTDIQFTSLSGASVSPVAEYIVMMMLSIGHRLPDMIANQVNAHWPDKAEEKFIPRKELCGTTVGIVGYGSVGRELARQLQSFGVKVLAIKRDVMNPQDNGYYESGRGDPGGDLFHRLYPIQALHSMIRDCDFIVSCLPDTHETQSLFNGDAFQSMKQGAIFIHIGGGKVVDEKELINALQQRLGGAVIDSFSHQPLPPENPLWHQPNLIITPHLSGYSPYYSVRAAQLFIENLKNYLSGTPLLNLFDRQLGY